MSTSTTVSLARQVRRFSTPQMVVMLRETAELPSTSDPVAVLLLEAADRLEMRS